VLVLFDNKTDQGFYKWIKRPGNEGQLIFENNENDFKELNNNALYEIVSEVKNWYSHQYAA
jgi:hypothetical protein